jgi:hypothetical protein
VATISIVCPQNQPADPYTTTGLWASGTYDDGKTTAVAIQLWLEYPAGTVYKSSNCPPAGPLLWQCQHDKALPTTAPGDWADLTAHLFDSGGTEIAHSDTVEIQLAADGVNDC